MPARVSGVEQVLSIGRSASAAAREIAGNRPIGLIDRSQSKAGCQLVRIASSVSAVLPRGSARAGLSQGNLRVTMSVARKLVKLNPGMTFIYVSGAAH